MTTTTSTTNGFTAPWPRRSKTAWVRAATATVAIAVLGASGASDVAAARGSSTTCATAAPVADDAWTGDVKDHPRYRPVWTGDVKDHPLYRSSCV